MSRPTTSSTASDGTSRHEQMKLATTSATARNRTYSDSYQLEYDDTGSGHHLLQFSQYHPRHHDSSIHHIDRLASGDYERRSTKSGTTHNSLSLSLGSSLDNLLLVDAQSQSGLSPNSNTSGTGCTGAMHSLSGSSGNHPSDATGRLTGNFQDFEVDEDVFVTDVVDGCTGKSSRYHIAPPPITRLNKQTTVVDDDSDIEIPPVLPEKRRINRHYATVDHGYLGLGEGGYGCYNKQQQQYNARCHSPYDNVDENDSILQCWPNDGVSKGPTSGQQPPFMTQSESRVTLVGTSGNDSEERPPLPPKKKHSLSKLRN